MAQWLAHEDTRWARPIYDLDVFAGEWACTPEPDGTWTTWRGPRFHIPILRFEGTAEEIAREIQALRDTCPYRGSYGAPERYEEPFTVAQPHGGRWLRTDDPKRVVYWMGLSVHPAEPRPLRPLDEATRIHFAERMEMAEEYPLQTEAEAFQESWVVREDVQPGGDPLRVTGVKGLSP